MTEQPIACTLTTAELPARLAELRAIGAASLGSAEVRESEAVLRFGPGRSIRDRLAAVVAAESRCCAFLDFDLQDARDGVVLRIQAPAGGEPVMRQLVDAFRGDG